MRTVCDRDMCSGCMACVNVCKKNAISICDDLKAYNAQIDETKCVNCELCKKVCPNENPLKKSSPILWKEGWSDNSHIRELSSSGGIASELICSFIESGGYVASCLFEEGRFVFKLTDSIQLARMFAGSKYVKSNPRRVYTEINTKLEMGEKVLFIGLPCQVAALKRLAKKQDNLYTVDLICHGTPSPKLLDMYLQEKSINLDDLPDLHFRKKTSFGLRTAGEKITVPKVVDMYTYAFLKAIDYTENCYQCRYASLDRVSDITLGDSWGSEMDENEKEKGISLVLCQTEKGRRMLENARLQLFDVDIEKAIQLNHQLKYPTEKTIKRTFFYDNLSNGFEYTMRNLFPDFFIKNTIKTILYKLGVRR